MEFLYTTFVKYCALLLPNTSKKGEKTLLAPDCLNSLSKYVRIKQTK